MLLNYHIGCSVLSSLCVGDLVWLGLSSARVVGFQLSSVQTHIKRECKEVAFLSSVMCH